MKRILKAVALIMLAFSVLVPLAGCHRKKHHHHAPPPPVHRAPAPPRHVPKHVRPVPVRPAPLHVRPARPAPKKHHKAAPIRKQPAPKGAPAPRR